MNILTKYKSDAYTLACWELTDNGKLNIQIMEKHIGGTL